MKVVFLDIDGPMLSHRARQHPRNQPSAATAPRPLPEPIDWTVVKAPRGSDAIRYFDELAVALVRKLLVGHRANLVISSSWQRAGLSNVRYILEENGIPSSHLHTYWKTDFFSPRATRAEQIEEWLRTAARRGENIEAYAALDDDRSVKTIAGGVVVPYSDGIRWCDFCSASAALGAGIAVSALRSKGGNLTAVATTGPLGEAFVFAHGAYARQVELGSMQDSFGPAPPWCLRLRNSEYQLVRFVPADVQ